MKKPPTSHCDSLVVKKGGGCGAVCGHHGDMVKWCGGGHWWLSVAVVVMWGDGVEVVVICSKLNKH